MIGPMINGTCANDAIQRDRNTRGGHAGLWCVYTWGALSFCLQSFVQAGLHSAIFLDRLFRGDLVEGRENFDLHLISLSRGVGRAPVQGLRGAV